MCCSSPSETSLGWPLFSDLLTFCSPLPVPPPRRWEQPLRSPLLFLSSPQNRPYIPSSSIHPRPQRPLPITVSHRGFRISVRFTAASCCLALTGAGCCDRAPQTGWLTAQTLPPSSGGWGLRDGGAGGPGPQGHMSVVVLFPHTEERGCSRLLALEGQPP